MCQTPPAKKWASALGRRPHLPIISELTLTHKSGVCHNGLMNENGRLGPGNQRMTLNVRELYPNLEKFKLFENRLDEFLALDTITEIIDYSDGVLTYSSESVIPSRQDMRPPIILLFGNPAPESVRNKCFFARKDGGNDHKFWPTLANAGVISFDETDEDINEFRTKNLFNVTYDSPFRIGLTVFHSIPSPASGPKWSGVAGLRKLFGIKILRKIADIEKKRVERIILKFIGHDNRGAVITFQKDAYLGVKDCNAQERVLVKEGIWSITEAKCSLSKIRLFNMTITRYMISPNYAEYLRYLRDYILGDN